MKLILTTALLLFAAQAASVAHDISSDDDHPHYDWSVRPPEKILIRKETAQLFMQAAEAQTYDGSRSSEARQKNADSEARFKMPAIAKPFSMFPERVKMHWDERFLYVESNGIPNHNMMIGISSWQQQVPIPQPYYGDNAWILPLYPKPSTNPSSIKDRFLRGAIALAANGIPIFNPQNNRGEIAQEIGELDQWGGHCGRADDYHYHAAPLHLQPIVGKDQPIAYALDGYPIYGLTEPDGAQPSGLDAFDGHSTAALGYHYHASKKYPYVNGGFYGEVREREGQVDPQPRAQPIRQAQTPLRGAVITGFNSNPDGKSYSLRYSLNGGSGTVNYTSLGDGLWKFEYIDPDGTRAIETYKANANPRDRIERRIRANNRERPDGRSSAEIDDGGGRGDQDGGGRGDQDGGGRRDQNGGGRRDQNGGGRGDQNGGGRGDQDGGGRRDQNGGGRGGQNGGGRGDQNGGGRRDQRNERGTDYSGAPGEAFDSSPAPESNRNEGKNGVQNYQTQSSSGLNSIDKTQKGSMTLSSKVIPAGAELPIKYTGDGSGISPPLEWTGAPAGSKSFALIMHHIDREGRTKWYWTVYNIPGNVRSLPENAQGIGTVGSNSINNRTGYAPPHSKGPGSKTYTITLYALSSPLKFELKPSEVDRDALLNAMRGKLLCSAELRVVYTRKGEDSAR